MLVRNASCEQLATVRTITTADETRSSAPVKLMIHYTEFQRPQEVETIQQDLGADSRPKAKKVYEVEENMKNSRQTDRCIVNRSKWEKYTLGKALSEVWRDLQADPKWKYEQLDPVQLLGKSEVRIHLTDNNELVRAIWFWSRRPRLLSVASSILWIAVALGLPFWLFRIPSIGVPLIIVAAVVVNTDLVQSLRWRRQYESIIDRLIRTIAARDSGGPSRSNL